MASSLLFPTYIYTCYIWVQGFRVLYPIYTLLLKFAQARLLLHMLPNSSLQSTQAPHTHQHYHLLQHQEVGIELADSLQISLPTSIQLAFPATTQFLWHSMLLKVCAISFLCGCLVTKQGILADFLQIFYYFFPLSL